MKSLLLYLVLVAQFTFGQAVSLNKTWSTYYGDGYTLANTAAVDKVGNLYVVGTIKGSNSNGAFTTTTNAHQTQYGGGTYDGFITKFSPDGQVVWATFLGGTGNEVIENISIDNFNNLYISGTTSSANNIATSGSYRPNLVGTLSSFFSKFTSNGQLVWSTYYVSYGSSIVFAVGDNTFLTNTSLTCDSNDNIFIISLTEEDNQATANTFQFNRQTAKSIVSKFSPLGERIWSSYYGINESNLSGLCVNETGLYISGRSNSCTQPNSNYFATPNCYQSENYGECGVPFITKFNLIGQREWSTYFGGNNILDDTIYKNSIKCFGTSIYFVGLTASNTNISTVGSFQESKDFYQCNYLIKFNSNGEKVWGTYYGLNILDNYLALQNKLDLDNVGNIIISGVTNFQNNISTPGCFQNSIVPVLSTFNLDSYLIKFNPQGERLWGTYFGGVNPEYFASAVPYNDYFYLIGTTQSTIGISNSNGIQPNFNSNGVVDYYDSNVFLTRFDPIALTTTTFNENLFSIYPNPSSGYFIVSLKDNVLENRFLELFDTVGKKIMEQKLSNSETIVKTDNLSKGVYLVKINLENDVFTKKIIID